MAELLSTTKLHAFDRQDTTYTSFDGLKIGITVFVPKNVDKGSTLPVLVRWHGGALINGGRDYEPWFPRWIIELAALHKAIIVCPDYRLLPESPGLDILSDLHNFYTWLHTSLSSFLISSFSDSHPTSDLSNILITGESAGGYMAIQSSLLGETKGVKAVIAHYPMIDLQDAWYSIPSHKEIFNQPPPSYPPGWLDAQLKVARAAAPVTSRIPKEEDLDLFVASLQQGRYTEILGVDASLFPLENLKKVKEEGKPLMPMWIFHGDEDSIIPIQGTWKFMEEVKSVFGENGARKVESRVVVGKEHGFDNDEVGLEVD
ncbi:alpha/beta-hydrolase, partial [Aureobasidium pullulans]